MKSNHNEETEDVKTLEEFEQDPRAILRQVRRTKKPLVVTEKGKSDLVILDAATYEKKIYTLNLALMLAEAEAELQAGLGRPADEFLKDLRHAQKKISSRNHASRRK